MKNIFFFKFRRSTLKTIIQNIDLNNIFQDYIEIEKIDFFYIFIVYFISYLFKIHKIRLKKNLTNKFNHRMFHYYNIVIISINDFSLKSIFNSLNT